jgi:hypothetical protein
MLTPRRPYRGIMTGGFVPVSRGLLADLLESRIGVFEAGVHVIILLQADYSTGVWMGSAGRLMAAAPRGSALRDMQRAIQRLAHTGLIRVFHKHGARGNYRVLIDGFEPRIGALTGLRLNAHESTSWEHPIYERCAEPNAEPATEPGPEPAPNQEVRTRMKKRSKIIERAQRPRTARSTTPLIPHFQEFQKRFSHITATQFAFAIDQIELRATTRPNSSAFWKKSLTGFFVDFDRECKSYLTGLAFRLFKETDASIGDISEKLKSAAAANDLAYTADLIGEVIVAASKRLERDLEAAAYVNAGTGPSVERGASLDSSRAARDKS